MSKTGRWVLDLEEKFFTKAEEIVKDSDTLDIAKSKVEMLRAGNCNWMDQYDVEDQVEMCWNA